MITFSKSQPDSEKPKRRAKKKLSPIEQARVDGQMELFVLRSIDAEKAEAKQEAKLQKRRQKRREAQPGVWL
jgi:hypothetical protein